MRGDVFHVAGGLFLCSACLVQVLFALNEQYFTNEKGSVRTAGSFPLHLPGFEETVSAVVAMPGANTGQLCESVRRLEELLQATRQLTANSP